MIRFLFVPVTYNSYDALEAYIGSVSEALRAAGDSSIQVEVSIADNSSEQADFSSRAGKFTNLTIRQTFYGNPGYLTAALRSIYAADYAAFDYIVISNSDVLLDPTFFTAFSQLRLNSQTVWIAPQIYSESEQRDVNPKIQQRYTKRHLQLLRMLFRFPVLYYLYTKSLYSWKVKSGEPKAKGEKIYAGHGSFMIFTRNFFVANPALEYPVFLFCEEIFLAEIVQKMGRQIAHCPSVRVWDKEHASTGLMHLSRYCKYNYEALSYIIKRFY